MTRWRLGGWPLAVPALLVGVVLLGHGLIPDLGGAGTLLASLLPWLGLAVPVLAVPALLRRRGLAAIALIVPTLTWGFLFVPALWPAPTTAPVLTVADQNIDAANRTPCAALRALAAQRATLVAVEDLTSASAGCAHQVLDARYPQHVQVGTVGLWSADPLRDEQPLELGLPWYRALRVTVDTAQGPVAVDVVHLPSIRLGATAQRDQGLVELARQLATIPAGPALVIGDLNTATTDPRFGLLDGYRDSQVAAGGGFGFTWPSEFPATRPDHILFRGLRIAAAGTLPADGSDHLGITAGFGAPVP